MASNQHQEKEPAEAGPNTIPSRAAEAVMIDAIDTVAAPDFATTAKAFSTWQARFGLAGWELKSGANDRYSAARWGLGSELATLDDVEAFARRVGVSP